MAYNMSLSNCTMRSEMHALLAGHKIDTGTPATLTCTICSLKQTFLFLLAWPSSSPSNKLAELACPDCSSNALFLMALRSVSFCKLDNEAFLTDLPQTKCTTAGLVGRNLRYCLPKESCMQPFTKWLACWKAFFCNLHVSPPLSAHQGLLQAALHQL